MIGSALANALQQKVAGMCCLRFTRVRTFLIAGLQRFRLTSARITLGACMPTVLVRLNEAGASRRYRCSETASTGRAS